MKTHKMTAWDAGQDLIACVDTLGEKEKNLRNAGFIKLADTVRKTRLALGDAFNAHDSHTFGLPGSEPPASRCDNCGTPHVGMGSCGHCGSGIC